MAVLLNEVITARLSAYGINAKRVSTKYGDMTMMEHRRLTDPDDLPAPRFPWERITGSGDIDIRRHDDLCGIPAEWLEDMESRKGASRRLKGRNDHKF